MDAGGFHSWGVVSSAALNVGVHVSLEIQFSPLVRPGVGWPNHMPALFLFSSFERTSQCSPELLLPTNSHSQDLVGRFSLLRPVSEFPVCRIFADSYPDWCVLLPPHGCHSHLSSLLLSRFSRVRLCVTP